MANLSFQDAEKIIRENPKQADALAFEAQEFLKNHPEASPTDTPQSVLDGKAISEAYSYLREQHEDLQMHESGGVDRSIVPQELMGMPLLAMAFLQKPKIMEDDRHYQQIEEQLKKEWLKNNPEKDFSSKEGLDYLYGPLDDRTKTSLRNEAEKSFRNNPKYKKNVERYDKEAKKIYKNHEHDPKVWAHKQKMQMEINARLSLLERGTKNASRLKLSKEEIKKYQDQIAGQVHRKYLREFAQNYPEKTKFYHEKIKAARKSEQKAETKPNISLPRTQEVAIGTPAPATGQAGKPSSPSFPLDKRGIPKKNLFKNPLKGLKNPFGFGKIGSKTAGRVALRGLAAFLFNPVVIALVSIVVLTFVIVMFGGAPGAPPSLEPTTAPLAAP